MNQKHHDMNNKSDENTLKGNILMLKSITCLWARGVWIILHFVNHTNAAH